MGGKGAKRKGKRLEELVAQTFTEMWNKEEGFFRRSQSSGTYRYEYQSDIIVPSINPNPLIVECKNRENWTYKELLNFSGNVKKWFIDLFKRYVKLKRRYINELNRFYGDFVYLLIIKHRYEEPLVVYNPINIYGSRLFYVNDQSSYRFHISIRLSDNEFKDIELQIGDKRDVIKVPTRLRVMSLKDFCKEFYPTF